MECELEGTGQFKRHFPGPNEIAEECLSIRIKDSQDPIIRHFHQPIGSVSLLNVPVALRSDRRCLDDGQSGGDANDRTGLAIRC